MPRLRGPNFRARSVNVGAVTAILGIVALEPTLAASTTSAAQESPTAVAYAAPQPAKEVGVLAANYIGHQFSVEARAHGSAIAATFYDANGPTIAGPNIYPRLHEGGRLTNSTIIDGLCLATGKVVTDVGNTMSSNVWVRGRIQGGTSYLGKPGTGPQQAPEQGLEVIISGMDVADGPVLNPAAFQEGRILPDCNQLSPTAG